MGVYDTLHRLFERLRIPEILNLVFYVLYTFCIFVSHEELFIGTVKYTFIKYHANLPNGHSCR